MASGGQFVTVKLMRSSNDTPWGFRLQGGAEFGLPLSVVKVTGGSLADQCGMLVGDILLKINGKQCETARHKDAQDTIISAGNMLELYLERGPMNTWRPSVTPVGDSRPNPSQVYTQTSLAKSPEKSVPGIGSGHNSAAKPFTANPPTLVHLQYNSPVNLYSEKNIEETLNAHSQVLATGATGINFMRPDAPVNKESAVYQMVHDEEVRKSKGNSGTPETRNGFSEANAASGVIKHVDPPHGKPNTPAADTNPNRNICAECERLIVGVFVRINNKSLHAECFRCATCGTSLKNIGYFNINDKLYCDIHARQVKAVLGASAHLSMHPATATPVVVEQSTNQFSNGHGKSNGFAHTPTNIPFAESVKPIPPPAVPAAVSATPMAPMASQPIHGPINPPSYQPAQTNISQNGFQNVSGGKKYSPVAPPTAPKPNLSTNRNSMYVNNPAPFSVESSSHMSGDAIKSDLQTLPKVTQNVVTYRQTVQHQERPKSCFNLPSYCVTSSAYTTTSTNYGRNANVGAAGTNVVGSTNTNLQFPKTATFASTSTHTTQKVFTPAGLAPAPQPVAQGMLPSSQPPMMAGRGSSSLPPQAHYGPAASLGRQWSSSNTTTSYGKSTTVSSDARAAPKRGRGLLQSQLSGGVIPFCGYCSQPIRGQYIMALNKTWCPNHFVCANTLCKRSLEENGFVEEQNRLYCETCYETHFAPACAKCNQRIKGDCLNALDKQWHPNCFSCSYCKKPFGNNSFYLEDGFPYCEKDWNDLFTTKCVGCGFPIAAGDRWVEALNQNYHSNCFKCTVCRGNLEGQSFFAKSGRPYCRAHAR